MRIARRNQALAAIWVLLLVLTWTLRPPGPAAGSREVGRLFPHFTADQAQRVVLERAATGSVEPGAEGERPPGSIELERRDLGAGDSTWVLPAHFDHPANSVAMRHLFDAVTSLTNLDLLSQDPARHGDYGVGASGLTVRVLGAGGELLAGFVQGADASTGTGLASYVRPLGDDAVYRAPRVGPIPLDPLRWLDRQWVAFQPALVREVRITADGSTRTWTRTDMERWSHAGSPVSARLMRAFLDRLAALFFDDVAAASPGERRATLEIRLLFADGDERVLSFARDDAEGTREAWLGPDRAVVRFSAATSALLSKSLRALEERR